MTPFIKKLESVQYNAALAIRSAMRGTSREKLYQELALELLRKRQWYRKLCPFFKMFKGQTPEYLFRIVPSISKAYNTRTNDKIPLFMVTIYIYFSSTVSECNNLD